ncbi:hypothetical protein [Sorangium sp. So ce1389]|uniref:hypothetical protein n=1 Tax=Sorangium sp. So ce1389 TaxID=3133336 RepID=UPI003F62148C
MRATSGAGDWTPVLSAGELRAGAGELLEGGLDVAAPGQLRSGRGVGEDTGELGAAAQLEGDLGLW